MSAPALVCDLSPSVGDTRPDPLGGELVYTGERWADPYSPEARRALGSKAANENRTPTPFIDLAAWIDRDLPERQFLVPGLIPGGCVTSLYGDGGSGKTLIALWLMVAMASRYGAKWLDEKPLGFKSVGLFAEDDEAELVRRLVRICEGLGLDFAKVAPNITPVAGVGLDTIVAYFADTGDLVITPLMEDLLARVKREGASLLVLDYAASVFGGNEIDRWQVSTFMRRLNAIARDNDIAILLLGHPSVDGMKGGRGTSGSTAWRNQSRSFLHLTVDETQDDAEGRRLLTLSHSKANYGPCGRTFKLASDGGRFEILETQQPGTKKPKGPRLSSSQQVALKALNKAISESGSPSPGGPVPNGSSVVSITLWREYAYSMGVSPSDTPEARKRAFRRAVQDLTAKGAVGVAEPYAWVMEGATK